jgi:hypothetical protein|tara:strand:- start:62 stop:268 length:207 start_codon:yes stop_codon:yes gene_type:complete
MMDNQPNPSQPYVNFTLQDNLFETFKIFWKAGFSYSKTGRDEDFYARVLEDIMNMPQEEFLKKYSDGR